MKPKELLQKLDQRMKSAALMVGRAVAKQPGQAFAVVDRELFSKRSQQTRLADPRLAGDVYHLATPVPNAVELFAQQAEIDVPAYERGQPALLGDGEAGPRAALAHRAIDPHRPGDALEGSLAQFLKLEKSADKPVRRVAQEHLVGLGQPLQPGRDVRRLTQGELLAPLPGADLPCDHPAGVDP